MNSIRFFLLGKHFICPLALICPLVLNDHFTGLSNLDCRSLLFITLNISCQSLLACKVSIEKSCDNLKGAPLYITNSFLLLLFKILSLSLTFAF